MAAKLKRKDVRGKYGTIDEISKVLNVSYRVSDNQTFFPVIYYSDNTRDGGIREKT